MVGRWMFGQATNVRVHSIVEEFVTCDGALRQQANSAAKHDCFCSALCKVLYLDKFLKTNMQNQLFIGIAFTSQSRIT